MIAEPHDSYTFYLPVATMERFREIAEAAGRSYSDAMLDAVNIYLAANIQRLSINASSPEGGNGID